MASSKSSRSSVLLSSFSFSSLRSSADADANADKHQLFARQRPRPSSSHQQLQTVAEAVPQVSEHPPLRFDRSPESDGEPPPPPRLIRKSKTWSDRFTSFLPSLTTSSAGQSILRKPVGAKRDSPTELPPPPPYDAHDSARPSTVPSSVPSTIDMRNTFMSEGRDSPQYDPRTSTFLQPTIPDSSFSDAANIQIMPPIPPSPEAKRSTLTKPPPAPPLAPPPAPPLVAKIDPVMDTGSSDDPPRHGKLVKEAPGGRSRRSSVQLPKSATLPIGVLPSPHTSPAPDPRGRSISAQHHSAMRASTSDSRMASTPVGSRPVSKDGSQSPTRGRLRRSWLPGGRSRSNSMEVRNDANAAAWVMSDGTQAEYKPSILKNAEKVPELWNESGDVLVYLYPKASGCGPSFKVQQYTINYSRKFTEWVRSEDGAPATSRSRARSFDGRGSLSVEDATRLRSPPTSPSLLEPADGELRLYLRTTSPTGQLAAPSHGSDPEIDRLIAIRNLFAFLTGQPLVGTKANGTVFKAFLQIASLLREFEFMGDDGNSFGTPVEISFGFYLDQLGLADCRHSREKTVEALILGERMRSTELYNEAFTHAAGKLQAITELHLPLFDLVSRSTQEALEHAKNDIRKRQHNVNEHLEQFEFPSLFAGVASSTSNLDLRQVRFKVWRSSFNKMRQLVLGHYKTTFGNWPPKASSKKNPFAESGLNRLVLKVLYSDMCALYDMLVDRTKLTIRAIDVPVETSEDADKVTISALQNIMNEFDRSKPPVLLPIPFDMPQLPSMTSIVPNFNALSAKDQIRAEKKIKENELLLILNKAYNFDTSSIKLPFLEEFKAFEHREGRGRMAQDLVDQRIGYWLFLYVVIQSLPLLVVDAPSLKFTEGTEYFLCRPPIGNPPWYQDRQHRMKWFQIADGGGHVELNEDTVKFSIEATFHRSHCWLAAKRWDAEGGAEEAPPEEPAMSPLAPPPSVFQGGSVFAPTPPPVTAQSTPSPPLGGPQMAIRSRNLAPAGIRTPGSRSSMIMGIEPMPLDPPDPFGRHNRSSSMGPPSLSGQLGNRSASAGNLAALHSRDSRASMHPPVTNSGATFDDILGGTPKKDAGKKKSRFF